MLQFRLPSLSTEARATADLICSIGSGAGYLASVGRKATNKRPNKTVETILDKVVMENSSFRLLFPCYAAKRYAAHT